MSFLELPNHARGPIREKPHLQAPPSLDYVQARRARARLHPHSDISSRRRDDIDYEWTIEEDENDDISDETKPFETDESAPTPPHPAYRITSRLQFHSHYRYQAWSDSELQITLTISFPSTSPSYLQVHISSVAIEAAERFVNELRSSNFPFTTISTPNLHTHPHQTICTTYPGPTHLLLSIPHTNPLDPLTVRRGQTRGYTLNHLSSVVRSRTTVPPCIDRQIRRDPKRYVGYGITDSWDEIVETLQGAPVSTDTELGAHMREFESMVRRDTDEIYTRRTHAHTRQLMETEAGMSREAWGRAMDASDLAHGGVISLCTTVHAQMSEITELQSADRRRQRAMSDLLETDRRRHKEMRELRAADRTQQQQII
ncbi:hypothetical protein Tco_1227273 [Tanacetum coccineum]